MKDIKIFGAGLVGSLLAILLRQKGYKVCIYERRSDMRRHNISAGKSINLALSNRGWKALEKAGLREEIEKISLPMYGREIHKVGEEAIFQPYGKNGEAIYSVSRGELNKTMMTLAEKEGVEIIFNARCHKVNLEENSFHVEKENGKIEKVHADLLFGADGAFSALRNAYVKRDRFNYQQFYLKHGYKELYIPPANDGGFRISKDRLHIWPRKNYMLIALPNSDGSFTCTLFFPFEGNPSFDTVKTKEDVLHLFETQFPSALAHMPTLLDDYFENPTSALVTVKCEPWHYQDKSALIGDAAHAIVPFYGQGMNAGFEDCSVLIERIENAEGENWGAILAGYAEQRKVDGDAIADLAIMNFVEMRDLVSDERFLLRKKLEKEIGRDYADLFNSVYEMVSFSHTPYSRALGLQNAQNDMMNTLLNSEKFPDGKLTDTNRSFLEEVLETYRDHIQ